MNTTLSSWVRRAGGSLLFLGYIPFMPGTLGAAATTGAVWYLHLHYPGMFSLAMAPYFWLLFLGLCTVSFWLGRDAERVFGRDDPPRFIFDEVVGQFLTYFMIPLSWRTLLLGFLLFRFFDIVKPFPVHRMEEMEGGVGITMDDVAAGACANLTMVGILALYHMIQGYL